MTFHQLSLFCKVVEQGSIARAARILYISQPSLTIQIKRLERELGACLIQATRHGLVMTEAGRLLYEYAQRILELERTVRCRVAEVVEGTSRTLFVGVSPTGALYRVAGAIKCFKERHREIEIHLHVDLLENILTRLLEGSLDMIVEWDPVSSHQQVDVIPIEQVPFGVIISPAHPLASQDFLTREQFKELPYLSLPAGSGQPGHVEKALIRAALVTHVTARLPSIDALKWAVEAGLGVTVVSIHSVRREVNQGLLKWLPITGVDLHMTMVCALAKGRHRSRETLLFTKLLQETGDRSCAN